MKLISTIAEDLRRQNPEIGRPTAQDLNNMLLVKGLICVVKEGKCPTAKGQNIGIGKKSGWNASGQRYCTPVYNEQAEEYVKTLAIKYFTEIAAQVNAPHTSEPAAIPVSASPSLISSTDELSTIAIPEYHYTHKDYDSVKIRYRDHLIFLEGPDSYWTYFQDARKLSRMMQWDVYVNRNNIPGIAFQKDELSVVLQVLENNQIEWVVCDHQGERVSADYPLALAAEAGEEETVEIGSYVRVRINNFGERNFFIRDSNLTPVIAHVSPNGLVLRTVISNFENDSVTIDSPAGQALIGRRVGDIVQVASETGDTIPYQILEIK